MSEQPAPGIDRWIEETSAFDRVRSVTFSLQQPRTAGQIADEAQVSEKTARGHLQRLVEMDLVLERGADGATTYYPDPGYVRYREVRSLVREHDRDELVEIVGTLKGDVESWQEEYSVETPDDLRASVAGQGITEREVHERQRIADDWEYTEHRLELLGDALARYDRLSGQSSLGQ